MNRIGLVLSVCGLVALLGPAWANPIHIECTEASCEDTWTLTSDTNAEFRGKCDGRTPNGQVCSSNSGKVTCTITAKFTDYATCSCKNWDFTGRHEAKVRVDC